MNKENIFSVWKEKGRKEAFSWFKNRFVMLETPEQLLIIKIFAVAGAIVGMILAIIFLIHYGFWYLSFATGFMTIFQYAELKGLLQQYKQFKDLTEACQKISEVVDDISTKPIE